MQTIIWKSSGPYQMMSWIICASRLRICTIRLCGSVAALIPDFIDAGFDILNPVQYAASDMDPASLNQKYGEDIVFWGGGVDTQKTLPFGTPEEVRTQVKERLNILGKGAGFIFCAIHNIQPQTPIENLLALFEAFAKYRNY